MLKISSVFIPNSRQAQDYVSLYKETVRATSDQVTLFLVIEIKGDKKQKATKNQADFDKLAQTIAKSLKTTYLTESRVTEYTFEKALSNINHELSALARRGVSGWYKKLNGLVGVYYKNTLSVSVTGTASAFMLRENEFTNISESLSTGSKPHPLKTFLHFASGGLTENDLVILGSASLYNYISLDRLGRTLSENGLDDSISQLTNSLENDASAQDSFATIVFKVVPDLPAEREEVLLEDEDEHTIVEDRSPDFAARGKKSGFDYAGFLRQVGIFLWKALLGFMSIVGWAYHSIRGRGSRPTGRSQYSYLNEKKSSSRKTFLVIFTIIVFLLLVNIIFSNLRNAENETKEEIELLLEQAATDATEAESRLIFDDENGALSSIVAAREKMDTILASGFFEDQSAQLLERIDKLYNQLNKITAIEPQSLGTFTVSPDQLVKVEGGFVGFNSFTESFEKYNTVNGQTNLVLPEIPNDINFIEASFSSGDQKTLFLSSDLSIWSLDADLNNFSAMSATSTDAGFAVAGLSIYTGRAYLIDKTNSQILRFGSSDGGFSSPGAWLDEPFTFSEARDLAVDGNIYVLLSNQIIKFTQGKKADFELPPLSESIDNAKKILTGADFQNIYVLDAGNSRVLVLSKQGTLVNQLRSDRFTDLKDFWVEEGSKTVYILNGDELLKFGF